MKDEHDQKCSVARREFCQTLALGSWALLAVPAATETSVAQQAALHYPACRIEGAEQLLPGSAL